jgi:predicted oxidoreductase
MSVVHGVVAEVTRQRRLRVRDPETTNEIQADGRSNEACLDRSERDESLHWSTSAVRFAAYTKGVFLSHYGRYRSRGSHY